MVYYPIIRYKLVICQTSFHGISISIGDMSIFLTNAIVNSVGQLFIIRYKFRENRASVVDPSGTAVEPASCKALQAASVPHPAVPRSKSRSRQRCSAAPPRGLGPYSMGPWEISWIYMDLSGFIWDMQYIHIYIYIGMILIGILIGENDHHMCLTCDL